MDVVASHPHPPLHWVFAALNTSKIFYLSYKACDVSLQDKVNIIGYGATGGL